MWIGHHFYKFRQTAAHHRWLWLRIQLFLLIYISYGSANFRQSQRCTVLGVIRAKYCRNTRRQNRVQGWNGGTMQSRGKEHWKGGHKSIQVWNFSRNFKITESYPYTCFHHKFGARYGCIYNFQPTFGQNLQVHSSISVENKQTTIYVRF